MDHIIKVSLRNRWKWHQKQGDIINGSNFISFSLIETLWNLSGDRNYEVAIWVMYPQRCVRLYLPSNTWYHFEASQATSDLTGPMPGQSRGSWGQVSSDLIRQDTQRWVKYAMSPVTSHAGQDTRGWTATSCIHTHARTHTRAHMRTRARTHTHTDCLARRLFVYRPCDERRSLDVLRYLNHPHLARANACTFVCSINWTYHVFADYLNATTAVVQVVYLCRWLSRGLTSARHIPKHRFLNLCNCEMLIMLPKSTDKIFAVSDPNNYCQLAPPLTNDSGSQCVHRTNTPQCPVIIPG